MLLLIVIDLKIIFEGLIFQVCGGVRCRNIGI